MLFDYFKTQPSNIDLSDKCLFQKLSILLLLLGAQSVNTIFCFHVDEMTINDISITFAPSHVLKHSSKSNKLNVFTYRSYPQDVRLCVVDCLKVYLDRRKPKVPENEKNLFITHKKPYKAATIDTLRRWVKNALEEAGIYNFSAHSCRSASTSKAKNLNIDLEEIMKRACWKNESTFKKHYDKEIIEYNDESFNKILEQ